MEVPHVNLPIMESRQLVVEDFFASQLSIKQDEGKESQVVSIN
jgi:hypothetical protein